MIASSHAYDDARDGTWPFDRLQGQAEGRVGGPGREADRRGAPAPPAPSLPEPAAPTAPADPRSVDELKTELAKTTSAIDAASALASDRSQPAEARAAAKTKLPALATEKRQLEALIKQKTEGEGAPKNLLGTGEGCTKDPASCN